MLKNNELGFVEVANKPSEKELEDYYANQYYQQEKSKTYAKKYSQIELDLIRFRINAKFSALNEVLDAHSGKRFLDVGCGEGFVLQFFSEQGYHVEGLDYSSAGLKQHNPDLVNKVRVGNISNLLSDKVKEKRNYDVIWLQNVLEHLPDPISLMNQLKELLAKNGVLVITVPNDFSPLQLRAQELGLVKTQYWVITPDHLSYFNTKTIDNFLNNIGWKVVDKLADFPIDWFIFNQSSNYVEMPSKGANAHQARLELEWLIAQNDISHVNQFYRALSGIQMGRNSVLILTR